VVDINTAMNTSDEVAILDLIILGINDNKTKNINSKLLILINKCDDLKINNGIPTPEDDELNDMYNQCCDIINARCKALDFKDKPIFTCISCEDAFIYRMIAADIENNNHINFDKLDQKYINRIGQLEFSVREWKKFNDSEKREKLLKILTKEHIESSMSISGFAQFRKIFNNILTPNTQYEFVINHINNAIINKQIYGCGMAIEEDLKWFRYIKAKYQLINITFERPINGDSLVSKIYKNKMEKFMLSHNEYLKDILPTINDINILLNYKSLIIKFDDNMPFMDILKKVNIQIKKCCINSLKVKMNPWAWIKNIIKTILSNNIEIKAELLGTIMNYSTNIKPGDVGNSIAFYSIEDIYNYFENGDENDEDDELNNIPEIYFSIMNIPEQTGITITEKYKAIAKLVIWENNNINDLYKIIHLRLLKEYEPLIKSSDPYWILFRQINSVIFSDTDILDNIDLSESINERHMKYAKQSFLGLFLHELYDRTNIHIS
jgi:hypothetical protein